MRYKLLGKSGLRVSELCLGTMTFGQEWEFMGAAKQECQGIFEAFVEAGGNFIDTANEYMHGSSERYVGEFLGSNREKFVLSTKYTLTMDPNDPNASGNHRKNMVQSVEASLKRLNTAYIDLLWLHAWDFMTPVEEVMRGLDDLVRSGKVLYVGVSDTPAWIISQANTLASLRGWTPFIGLQVQYNLLERTVERDLLPMAKAFDIGITAWSPLGGGILTGKYNTLDHHGKKRFGDSNPMGKTMLTERNLSIASEVVRVADDIGRTPAQVALNWVRQQNDKGVVIPIVGATKVSQVRQSLACLEFELNREHLQRLNEISQIEYGFPHDFLANHFIKKIIYGQHGDAIDNHREIEANPFA